MHEATGVEIHHVLFLHLNIMTLGEAAAVWIDAGHVYSVASAGLKQFEHQWTNKLYMDD